MEKLLNNNLSFYIKSNKKDFTKTFSLLTLFLLMLNITGITFIWHAHIAHYEHKTDNHDCNHKEEEESHQDCYVCEHTFIGANKCSLVSLYTPINFNYIVIKNSYIPETNLGVRILLPTSARAPPTV